MIMRRAGFKFGVKVWGVVVFTVAFSRPDCIVNHRFLVWGLGLLLGRCDYILAFISFWFLVFFGAFGAISVLCGGYLLVLHLFPFLLLERAWEMMCMGIFSGVVAFLCLCESSFLFFVVPAFFNGIWGFQVELSLGLWVARCLSISFWSVIGINIRVGIGIGTGIGIGNSI